MNRKTSVFLTFSLGSIILFLGQEKCFGQSWLDVGRDAQPKMNLGGLSNFGSQGGFPSTSFPSTSATAATPLAPGMVNAGVPTNGSFGVGPMLVPNRKDWKLGVFVQNRDIGAVITEVAPGSGGQNAGLERNDIIVAVGGNRIGAFDNRIVDLAEELRRSTDSLGRVSLLVMDSRLSTLQSLQVSMNTTSSTLSGSVMTRDRVQLPFGAMLTVQLQNATNPFYEILGGKSVTQASGVAPFSFELNFDPRYIDSRDRYQLVAFISSGNQEIYRLVQAVQVNPNSLGQTINLTLDRSPWGGSVNSGQLVSNQGNVVSAGYPMQVDPNAVSQLYIRILGRSPSAKETLAWNSYLQGGNSINDVAAKLMASPQFRDRFPNETAYLQQVVTLTSNRVPSQQELAFWATRLQATRSLEVVVGEILQRNQ